MSKPFTLAVTGQSLIHHDVRDVAEPGFAGVVETIQRADIAFTNFEGCIAGRHGGWPLKGFYFGSSGPEVLDALKAIGFNTLSLSNNHAFDLGPSGILSTLEEVRSRDFLHAGIGIDRADASRPRIAQLGGRKVALVAMDAGPGPDTMYADDAGKDRPARPGVNRLNVKRIFEVDPGRIETLREIQRLFESSPLERANYAQPNDRPVVAANDIDFWGTIFSEAAAPRRRIVVGEQSAQVQLDAISRAAAEGAFVIAYLHQHHWEPSWQNVPAWVADFAHRCVDAGADAFIGHGAPVLQAIEIYKGAPLFYGLGNFLFHLKEGQTEWSPPEVWKSVVATCHFDGDGRMASIDLLPVVLGGESRLGDDDYHNRWLPIVARGDLGRSILHDLRLRSLPYGTIIDDESGRITASSWPILASTTSPVTSNARLAT
jgi:poly-gamma-glutamate synthesis protein (capsule biosynthesis protein)